MIGNASNRRYFILFLFIPGKFLEDFHRRFQDLWNIKNLFQSKPIRISTSNFYIVSYLKKKICISYYLEFFFFGWACVHLVIRSHILVVALDLKDISTIR